MNQEPRTKNQGVPVMHGGEGEAGTGEINRRPGRFRSLCCAADIAVAEGDAFPACPRCGQSADWTWSAPLLSVRDAAATEGRPAS